ncbi:MAG TPA: tetratricopeptide repeat protein [Thermodesulfobacteriota bacterium]
MPPDAPKPERSTRAAAPKPRRGRFLAASAGILAFGLVVGVLLSQALRPRLGPDDVITGGALPAPGGPAPSAEGPAGVVPGAPDGRPDVAAGPSDAELDRLASQAEAAPADIEAQLALVRAALDAGRTDLALPAVGRILDHDPDHPAALTYLGLMTAAEGRVEHALALIDRALEAAPGDTFALWAKGGLLFSHGHDYAGAAAAWEAMLRSPRLDATTRAVVEEWVAEARWRQEHGEEIERPRAAAPAPAPIVTGTVTLGPGVTGGAEQAGALFVIARRGSGPPLAVKRIESPRFPVHYTLGPEDAMLRDRPVEGELEIVARLSRSGAAGPAQPGDLEGRFPRNPVRPGAANVDIVLVPVTPEASAGTPPASR